MERHFVVEIQEIKENLIKMGGKVETAIDSAVRALKNRDAELAREVIENDTEINELEIRVEQKCRLLLAKHQPVAMDLRFIMASIKINNDLERMGDHAVNVAQKAEILSQAQPVKPLIDIPYMASLAQNMVRDSLDSFVEGDVVKAKKVCENDDMVDGLEDQINRELLTYMMEDARNISQALSLSMVAKNLERIADLSTNICEEVIYMVEARTIKHHFEDVHVKNNSKEK
ncbi:MAG: phosphate signaling complex protein PhoU [bacterium]